MNQTGFRQQLAAALSDMVDRDQLTRQTLADAADVAYSTAARWVTGELEPSAYDLMRLARNRPDVAARLQAVIHGGSTLAVVPADVAADKATLRDSTRDVVDLVTRSARIAEEMLKASIAGGPLGTNDAARLDGDVQDVLNGWIAVRNNNARHAGRAGR